jgi:hypothetical protein
MNYFYLADKDGSGTLTKHECRHLLLDSLNAKIPAHIFEKYFQVNFYMIFSFFCCCFVLGSR